MNAINVLPSLANKEHSRILQKHTPFPMLISLTIYHHSTNIIISLSEPSFLLFLHQDCANYHIKCIFKQVKWDIPLWGFKKCVKPPTCFLMFETLTVRHVDKHICFWWGEIKGLQYPSISQEFTSQLINALFLLITLDFQLH